jgi:amino-acid N-acetyltransferase
MSETTLRRADGDDRAHVRRLLDDAELPTADLDGDVALYVATRDGERVGAGGLERRGDAALVRSVVVAPASRGEGHGRAIVDGLEARARDAGVEALYLLTTTAAEFFAARGYERIDRGAVPGAIAETTEFTALCPDSATCMRKEL